jgi:hypothetical protein
MKNKFFAVLFVVATLGFTSCNSDDSSPVNNPPANTATFTATMDGEAFVATQAIAVQEDGVITITGIRGDNGEKIELVAYRTSPGTSASISLKYFEDTDSVFENYHMLQMDFNGYVTLSEVNSDEVSGTFTFKGYFGGGINSEMVEISNGQFNNIPLTIISGAQTNTESLFAIVDGAELLFDTDINVANNAGIISVSGLNTSLLRRVSISMPQNIAVGTHAIGDDMLTENYASISGALEFQSASGTLTITNNSNGWLTGSFSFTGEDSEGETHQVTAGHFHVALD